MKNTVIANNLRVCRGNTPRSEVAKAVGISVSTLQMYENGERVPRDETKKLLSRYYNRTVGDIFFSEDPHETCGDSP